MSRRHFWLQLLIGWLPVWTLLTLLIAGAHGTTFGAASLISLRMILIAAILAIGVRRVTERLPWRSPVSARFVALHVLAAFTYAIGLIFLNSLIESIHERSFVITIGVGIGPFLALGVWFYVMIAGGAYTVQSAERAARAEAAAARAQLSALRSQLNPHFLFNALHTVVQLIPRNPEKASQAAEQVASLLRTTMEEDRDLVSVETELAFVNRYLELERLRFGDRLSIEVSLNAGVRAATIPSFSVQTLVENAVRHGAAPNVDATVIGISGSIERGMVMLTVTDNGVGSTREELDQKGTGLRRLRERLDALYSGAARLRVTERPGGGVQALLEVPHESNDE